jgi:uroporphyrinogen III methyltransferase/synthase
MTEPQVYLVGAGPGHPGLLTLRAVECLRRADLVLFDRLVAPALLEHAPPAAERLCVTELAGNHPERVPQVHEAMIRAARAGKRVVRLKGGDPAVFGRVGEEAEALRQAGVAFEIVPGVTAALGAAAYAGIPLTHRAHASAVALVTGHECTAKGGSALDWAALARFPGTLVFYMAVGHLEDIVRALLAGGKAADTPAAVVRQATLGGQRTVTAPLAGLPAAARAAGIAAPALAVVGPVVALRDAAAWFERQPLFGRGVLVTRPRHQAGELLRRLETLGAVPYLLPAVEVRPPADWAPVDAALARLGHYHWLVFTSANGVHALVGRLLQTGRDLRALGPVRLAAIGPSTAAALGAYHLRPDFMPATYNSEALAAGLRERTAGRRVLLARADRGRDVLRQELAAVADVEQVAVYSQVDSVEADPAVLDALAQGDIRYVTLTSSNIARSLARAADERTHARIRSGAVKLVTISGVTSQDVRALGWPVAAEATEATADGLVAALVALAEGDEEKRIAAGSSAEVAQRVPAEEQHQAARQDAENVHHR